MIVEHRGPRQVGPSSVANLGRATAVEVVVIKVFSTGCQVAHPISDEIAKSMALVQAASMGVSRTQVERHPPGLREILHEPTKQKRGNPLAAVLLVSPDELNESHLARVRGRLTAHVAHQLSVDFPQVVGRVQPRPQIPCHQVSGDIPPPTEAAFSPGKRRLTHLDRQLFSAAELNCRLCTIHHFHLTEYG